MALIVCSAQGSLAEDLKEQLEEDSRFMKECNIMDYSLLIGAA